MVPVFLIIYYDFFLSLTHKEFLLKLFIIKIPVCIVGKSEVRLDQLTLSLDPPPPPKMLSLQILH